MNKGLNRIVVAHPYQQHSFQTACAVKKKFGLYSYITTVYDKRNSFTGIVKKALKGDNLKRAGKRKCADLSDDEVIQFCEFESLILLLLYRLDKSKVIYKIWNKYILKHYNRKLAKYLIKNEIDTVILYDTVCSECIRILKDKKANTTIVIDMSAPSLLYMDMWFKKSVQMYPHSSDALIEEMKTPEYKELLDIAKYEIDTADYFLAASEFTKKSLQFSGINEERIAVCRYGINVEPMKCNKNECEKIRIVFIGNVTQKKGIIDFVKIVDALGTERFDYTVVGVYNPEDEIYKYYHEMINFVGYVTHDQVLAICDQMDVLIFPSLSDGFGLSVIEAMSRKVLPIVSNNAGVSDIISDGKTGFLFQPGDIEKVTNICSFLEQDRDYLRSVQNSAFERICRLKWDDYYDDIEKALELFHKSER